MHNFPFSTNFLKPIRIKPLQNFNLLQERRNRKCQCIWAKQGSLRSTIGRIPLFPLSCTNTFMSSLSLIKDKSLVLHLKDKYHEFCFILLVYCIQSIWLYFCLYPLVEWFFFYFLFVWRVQALKRLCLFCQCYPRLIKVYLFFVKNKSSFSI